MSTHEKRFRRLCRHLLRHGIKPTPTILNIYLGRYLPGRGDELDPLTLQPVNKRRRPNNLNGREAEWRREELLAAGWTEPVGRTPPGFWTPPR